MNNEKGITIVELLAALVIVSIITVSIWTLFSIGTAHSALETNKTKLQQDANIVISKLRNEHRQNDTYNLRFYNDQLEIKGSDPADVFEPVTNEEYEYSGKINNVDFASLDPAYVYDPETYHTDVVLKVADPDGSPSVTVKTSLTRILSD